MTRVSTGVTQGRWCVSGHPARPDFHGMIPSQQICLSFHQASNRQQKTSEPRPRRRERWRGEWKPPRTSSLLWQAHVACREVGEGTQIRVLQVTGMATSLGAFKIPWESVSLTFSRLSQLLNSPPLAWVGCQGLRVTQKHWKSIFPKLSGNEVTAPSTDAICYTSFYILARMNPKGSTVRLWLCYQKTASCIPAGLCPHHVTVNPRDSHKRTSEKPSTLWVPKQTSQKTNPCFFCKPPHSCISLQNVSRAQDCPKTWTQGSASTQEWAEDPWP